MQGQAANGHTQYHRPLYNRNFLVKKLLSPFFRKNQIAGRDELRAGYYCCQYRSLSQAGMQQIDADKLAWLWVFTGKPQRYFSIGFYC
jgi:hypothetical protein